MPRSVNDILYDRTVRHATFLSRYSNSEAVKIGRFLETVVYPDVVSLIRRRLDMVRTGSAQSMNATRRLQALQREIESMIREGTAEAYRRTTSMLRDTSVVEARTTQRIMAETIEVFSLSVTRPSDQILRAIVSNTMVRGEFLRDEFATMTARARRSTVAAINIGMVEGEGTDQIVRRIVGTRARPGGVMATTRHDARRLVRTAVNHTTTQARELTYQDNDDIVKGVQWVSTLDGRTSQTCIALDGQQFGVNEGPRPPAHPFCRSTTTPVLRSYKELGLDLPDLPPSTRASMNGQVSARLTYPEWLKTQPKAFQDQVLGTRLAKEWRAGRVPVTSFIDAQNRPLNLRDILRLEGID